MEKKIYLKNVLNQDFYKNDAPIYDHLEKSINLIIDNYFIRKTSLQLFEDLYTSIANCFKYYSGKAAFSNSDLTSFDAFQDKKGWYFKMELNKDEINHLFSIFGTENKMLLTRIAGLNMYDLPSKTIIEKVIPVQTYYFTCDLFSKRTTPEDEVVYMNLGGWGICLA